MSPSLRVTTAALLAALCISTSPHLACAEDKTFLAQAAEKWEQGAITEAAPLYEKALSQGGMFPPDVVLAHARIGTVHAAVGKKEAAMNAFRVAAVIDPEFQLPAESGPVAKKLYEEARKQAQKQGGKLTVTVEAPERVDAQKGFTVTAKLPEAFAPVVDKIGVEVRDTATQKPGWRADQAATAQITFEVPAKHVPGGTTLIVRVSALDPSGNRWAMADTKVRVREGKPEIVAAPEGPADKDEKSKSKKGFFAGPWPYAIAGAVVLAGIVGYAATRPPSHAEVSAPQWR
ncbi:MAG: hypothetical protein IT374_12700 [Polyangiaceae bacterium]|nr:hypothetical protein [Polyangiaceae bacterium]